MYWALSVNFASHKSWRLSHQGVEVMGAHKQSRKALWFNQKNSTPPIMTSSHNSAMTYKTSEQEIKFWEWLSSKLPWATVLIMFGFSHYQESSLTSQPVDFVTRGQFPGTWELVMWYLSKQSNTNCCIYALVPSHANESFRSIDCDPLIVGGVGMIS